MTDMRLKDDQWIQIRDYLKTDPNAYVGNEAQCRLFLEAVMIDSTIVRAHPCAAGAEKKR